MTKLMIGKELFDWFYPIGSYYETSDTNFNPTTAGWYGEWVEDTDGRVLVSLDPTQLEFNQVNKIGGSKYPSPHNMTLYWGLYQGGSGDSIIMGGDRIGSTAEQIVDREQGDSGNLQPYKVVKRWHRTA